MFTDLTDEKFNLNPQAVLVTGMYTDPWMSDFPGVSYSPAPFSMKAILVDGIVWMPDPAYTQKVRKSQRDFANYPMVQARVQPPTYAVRKVQN